MEDFATLLVGVWLPFGWRLVGVWLVFGWCLVDVWLVFGWCLVHKKGVPYSRTERPKQSSNLNLTMKP